MKPHKHAEIIKAWADGAEIQYYEHGWLDCTDCPIWQVDVEYRIKPEPPKYPQTNLTDAEMQAAASPLTGLTYGARWMEEARLLANAAIARAIEDGQVFLTSNYVDQLQFGNKTPVNMVPAVMLDKVAEAVRTELVELAARYSTGCATYINGQVNLDSIIAKVRSEPC
jgi:hypothetical protein